MNIELLKDIYKAVGASSYPRLSVAVVMLLAALVAGVIWYTIGKQVEKDPSASASQVSGRASTSGAKSPAVTGNGNTFTYSDGPTAQPKKKEK